MTWLKFCGEPVATATGKVAGSCGWCYHDNHPQRPSDAESENTDERAKKCVFTSLMGTSETDEQDSNRVEAEKTKIQQGTPYCLLFHHACL